MKSLIKTLACISMAITVLTVAFVSCKKETESTLRQKVFTIQQPFNIQQMQDPKSYFMDFKKKMSESKENEVISIENAAWHLACLANLDFCNVNVKYNNYQFDTIRIKVNITDSSMLMCDFRTAYEQMCTEIRQFTKGFNYYEQNLYYINVSIANDDTFKIALMTSFNTNSKYIWDHVWYFDDIFDALNACDDYFSSDSVYKWNTTAARELKRVLNLIEHHEYEIPQPGGGTQMVYLPTRNHSFNYYSQDPYYSTFLNNSRVFAKRTKYLNYEYNLDPLELCYCLDSYLNLGYEYMADNLYPNEYLICWNVIPINEQTTPTWWTHYHELYVEYGRLITPTPPGPEPD